MDRHEPQVPTNSNNPGNDTEALRTFANRAGNLLKIGGNKLTAAAVAGLLTITLAGCGANASAEGPKPTTTTSGEATPTPSATPESQYPDVDYSVEALEIPGTLSAEEAAKKIFEDQFDTWGNAGKSDTFKTGFDEAIHESVDGEVAYAQDAAAKNADTFGDAMFVPDWREKPALAKIVDEQKTINFVSLSLWAWTYHPDPTDALDYPDDQEPYERSSSVDSIETVDESETAATLKVVMTLHDNRSMNSAPTLTDQPDPNGFQLEYLIDLEKIDGKWKISQIAANQL